MFFQVQHNRPLFNKRVHTPQMTWKVVTTQHQKPSVKYFVQAVQKKINYSKHPCCEFKKIEKTRH